MAATTAKLGFFERLHAWRVEHVSERMFMLILALLVGFFAAVAAFSLHWIINQIVMLLTSGFETSRANWLYLVYPVIGIYLTSLFVRYIVKDNISHGITRILYAISMKVEAQVAQLLVVGDCLCHYHRLRRQCGSRGTDCVDGLCHRFESGQGLPHGP